ncbi:MAG: formylglycine-generating enzyme family protein [Bacteroidales bacterium]
MKFVAVVFAFILLPFGIVFSNLHFVTNGIQSSLAITVNADLPIVEISYLARPQPFQQKLASVLIESYPDAGMEIFVDGKFTGKYTPATIENIVFGKHTVRLSHPLYRSQEKTVEIGEATQSLKFTMVAAFAELSINTTNDAIIQIDGKVIGSTSWKGKLGEGLHIIIVKKEGFSSREQQVTILRGRDVHVDLMLSPKTGSLEITTDPPGVMITLNGKMYGLTPKTIKDLPLGIYNLSLDKPEYTSIIRRITISDSDLQKLEFSMTSGKEVIITSDQDSTLVYIDNEKEGVAPLKIWLKYGSHNIKLQRGALTTIETIEVAHGGSKDYSFTLSNTVDPFEGQLVFVKGGTFKMGDLSGDGSREETPVHQVTVNDFYMGKFEVTQSQWESIMGSNPSHFNGCPNCPVERVSWIDVQEFLVKLNELTGKSYRLPTEAEWEYAAKGGSKSRGFLYSGKNNVNFVAWYSGNSGNKTNPVGQKEPNELGIYDMSGNVWEWVNDWFNYYTETPKDNPTGPDNGDGRIVKGGSWFGHAGGNRVSCRGSDEPVNKRSYIGFRIVVSAADL